MKKVLIPARLIRRKNRFVASVLIDTTATEVYVPNTGRLSELAIPGAECLLAESSGKYRYKLLYIISNGFPVMIDSTLSNSLFAELLMSGKVPGLETYRLIRREPVYGRHRFDYLLADSKNTFYVELKSCTLFYRGTASFPDAVSSRASQHIRELSSIQGGRLILFILNDSAEVFVPNYHTDYEFYQVLKENAGRINISALRISYSNDLSITALTPVPVHIPEVSRAGYFFMILSGNSNGFYLYLSAYTDNVFDAVKKIKSRGKTFHNFCGIDGSFRILKDFPVIGDAHSGEKSTELFCDNGGRELVIPGPGTGRIFHFSLNPLEHKWFHNHILELRFSRYAHIRPSGHLLQV
ncbi:MAG TPA: DNA/RNA nuclease SfsA [Spirochaetota bacterium]|nr:DNA/RNA nuclease SfsA [Spirochaetota bacterium]